MIANSANEVAKADGTSECVRYWRIRMKYPGDDLTREAWEQGIIGIWYGAWKAKQFEATFEADCKKAGETLTAINKRAGLDWEVSPAFIDTARRFWNISDRDWVFSYFQDCIHLAKVRSSVERSAHPQFTRGDELFKYRRIGAQKTFALKNLPACFRLLSSAGRGNVHQVVGTRTLIRLLAESRTESEACDRFQKLSWADWFDVLGPHGWESLCLGYLILDHGFLPTSLDVGHTLPLFDLIGKNTTGHRIYAQCKKNPLPMKIDEEFESVAEDLAKRDTVFLFAYAGCTNVPGRVRLVTASDLQSWFTQTVKGKNYMQLLTH